MSDDGNLLVKLHFISPCSSASVSGPRTLVVSFPAEKVGLKISPPSFISFRPHAMDPVLCDLRLLNCIYASFPPIDIRLHSMARQSEWKESTRADFDSQ